MTARKPKSRQISPWVDSIWAYAGNGESEWELVMPTGGGQLLINLSEDGLRHWDSHQRISRAVGPVGLQGPLTKPVMIDSVQKTCICGVAFHPGGLSAFCDRPAQDFTDCLVDGTDVFGASASALRNDVSSARNDDERLDRIESFLLEHLRIRPAEDDLIRDLLKDVANGSNITTVRARYGLSQRRSFDLFDRRVGIRPKLLSRIERFAAALDALEDRNSWSDLAVQHGFSDQAHFIREFHQLSGHSPSRHQPLKHEPRHAKVGG